MNLKNKKILLQGLGILGGGVATAKWLVEQGAVLTVTDMKDEVHLRSSLDALKDLKIKFVLGRHEEKDFLENEIIVVNPDVPTDNKFVKLAKENGKQIENELSLFYKFCKSKNTVGITGTRGKTTTVNWTAHLLGSKIIGNSVESPFLGSELNVEESEKLVLEVPSFQLELLGEYVESDENEKLAPHISIITNLYQDHLNRHKTMEGYALAKANIFRGQTEEDYLILNKDDLWTDFFIGLEPKAKILFFSKGDNFISDFGFSILDFKKKWGEHNLLNLYPAILAARTLGISNEEIKSRISTLPQIKFRQEKVYESDDLEIYNDTTATSPEATVAALERFASQKESLILITGGTDRDLEFKGWAKSIKQIMNPENLILLGGSATEKMKTELGFDKYNEFETLEECFNEVLKRAEKTNGKSIILFSPSSKSFEKFKNEYDRGEKFNLLVQNLGMK